jgi:hypothetical protein
MSHHTASSFHTASWRGLGAACLLIAPWFAAQAHHVWLEPDADAATLYFGEFGGNLRETSPGLLDKFVKVTAYRQQAQSVVPLDVGKTARALPSRAASSPAKPCWPKSPRTRSPNASRANRRCALCTSPRRG